MHPKRTLKVIEGFLEISDPEAVLFMTNGKAQMMAHALDPKPDVHGKKDEVGPYRVVARPGVDRPRASFRKGETFGYQGPDLARGLRAQVEILEGEPWPEASAKPPPAPEPEKDSGAEGSGEFDKSEEKKPEDEGSEESAGALPDPPPALGATVASISGDPQRGGRRGGKK